MKLSVLWIGLAVALGSGCTKHNPDSCCTSTEQCTMLGIDSISNCDSARVCDATGTCIVPDCRTDSDCPQSYPICGQYGSCEVGPTLTVVLAGTGAGHVDGALAGFTCAAGTCTAQFAAGSQVHLDATAVTGQFLGWTNACLGKDGCDITLNADTKVGALFGTEREVLWSRRFSAGAGLEWGHGAATTVDGDLIDCGEFQGSMTLDSTVLSTGSDLVTGAYVSKLDGLTGKVIWAKSFPVDNADAVATDGDAYYVYGRFTGTVQLGPSVLNSLGGVDLYVMKLDARGEVQWAQSLGGTANDVPGAIAAGNGIVAVVGTDTGITIGTTTYPPVASAKGFIAAIDPSSGSFKWSRSFGGSSGARVFGVTMAESVLVSGTFAGSADFGAGTVSSLSTADAFVAQYTPDGGSLVELGHWGGASGSASAITAVKDSVGNLLVSGAFTTGLVVGGVTYSTTALTQAWVAKFNGPTNLWFQTFTTDQNARSEAAMIASGSNDLMVAGEMCGGSVYVDTVGLTAPFCSAQDPQRGTFLVKLKNNGTDYLSVSQLGPAVWTDAMARAKDDRLYVTGRYKTTLSVDNTSVFATGTDDGYILALAP